MARSLLAGLGSVCLLLHSVHASSDDATATESAKRVVDDFFTAWNNADNAAIHKLINFPHVFVLSEARVRISEGPDQLMTDFERMRTESGWDHSTLDSIEVTNASENAVLCEIVFSRRHEDGAPYWTVPALWIVTKQDDHWGLQARSIMPADRESPTESSLRAATVVEQFFGAWNRRDNDGLRENLHYPFLTLVGGRLIVDEKPEDFRTDFEALSANEDWRASLLDKIQILDASAGKVHCIAEYSRKNSDGEIYTQGAVLYVVTRADDKWGIQLRAPVERP